MAEPRQVEDRGGGAEERDHQQADDDRDGPPLIGAQLAQATTDHTPSNLASATDRMRMSGPMPTNLGRGVM